MLFLVRRTQDLLSQQLSNMPCSRVNCSHQAERCIPRTYLFYNRKFAPFDHLSPIPPPSSPSIKIALIL